MKNCDMDVVNAKSDGSFELLDTYSIGHSAPDSDTSMGGTYDLKEIKKTNEDTNYITVYYTKLLNTGDKYDAVLPLVNSLIYFSEYINSF